MEIKQDNMEKEPRQTPGDVESIKKVLHMIPDLPECPKILDIGCGTGIQSVAIAQEIDCQITAVDDDEHSLFKLNIHAMKNNVDNKISTVYKPVTCITFPDESFDLIWSEGTTFLIGLEEALKTWHKYLKPSSCLVFTELTWKKENPPEEILNYWNSEHPGITTHEIMAEKLGSFNYKLAASYIIPETAWWEDYYNVLQEDINSYSDIPDLDDELKTILEGSQKEINMYRKYSEFFGFAFYIAQKA